MCGCPLDTYKDPSTTCVVRVYYYGRKIRGLNGHIGIGGHCDLGLQKLIFIAAGNPKVQSNASKGFRSAMTFSTFA